MTSSEEKLFTQLKVIQEESVYQNAAEYRSEVPEAQLFSLSYDVIVKMLELFDGLRGDDFRLILMDQSDNHTVLTSANLHDLCSNYLRLE